VTRSFRGAICALLLAALPPGAAFAQMGPIQGTTTSATGQPRGGVNVAVCATLATQAASVTGNVATLTFASNPQTQGFVAGALLTVSGFTGGDTYFNGSFTIAAVSGTTISYALTHANAAAGTNGSVYQTGSSTQACAPLSSLFTDNTGNFASPNPFTSDGLGNYFTWAAPNYYRVQIYGAGVSTLTYPMGVGCVPLTGTSTCGVQLNASNALTGDNTHSGTETFTSINGTVYSDLQAGATLDVRLNACVTAAIAKPPHICNATNEGGVQTVAAQINVGDAGQDAVTVLLPSSATWTVTISDGTSCGMKQFGGSSLVGFGHMTGGTMHLSSGVGSNMNSLYCTDASPAGGGSYIRSEGFTVDGRAAATMASGTVALVQKLYDNSSYRDWEVLSYQPSTDALTVYGSCCGTRFDNVTLNNNSTGGRPLFIKADSSKRNEGLLFSNLSAGHSGSGFADIEISGGAAAPSDSVNADINFINLYTETGATGTVQGLKIVDARDVSITGWTAGVNANAAFTGLDISQTATNQVRAIALVGYNFQSAAGVGINNHITTKTYLTSTGYVPSYGFGGSAGSQISQPGIIEDNEQDQYDVGGNLIFKQATDGNFVVGTNADAQSFLYKNCGLTATQNCFFGIQDRGTVEWGFGTNTSNALTVSDRVNFQTRISIPQSASSFPAGLLNFLPRSNTFVADQGTACTNGELGLSAGWQSSGSATVTAVAGGGQTCSWTITTGTTTAANPTVTDTLTNALPAATTVCWMNIYGGTHVAVAGESLRQTTLSATAPVFTANFTPTNSGATYFVTRGCGP